MANDRPNPKERSLIEAAQREAPKGSSLLDAPTVIGWDHPTAQPAGDAGNEKWAGVAALMEAERRAAEEQRRKTRRTVIVCLVVLLGLVLIAVVRVMMR
jgi:hypothetical protein